MRSGKAAACEPERNRSVRRPGIPNRPYAAEEIETAVRMSIAGESDPAIGRAIGRTTESVRQKLEVIGLPGIRCNGQSHGLRLCLPNGAYAALADEADRRLIPAERLAAKLLTVIADDDMFRSILDL